MEELNEFREQWFGGQEEFIVHTSGSTGKPKDIALPRRDMIHSARATNLRFGITSASRLACPLSINYIAGKMMAVRAWEASAELVPLEVSNSFNLPEGSYDLLCIVPSMIPNLLNHPAWAGRVRNVLIGGSAPASEALMALVDSGYDIHVSYGMTETCSHIALAGIERIYEAMPGVNFSIDERGCLVIKAPGYSWGILTTNDVVELIDDCHFRWRGRIDNVINSGGIKLFPEELERLYAPFINAPFAVTSRPSVKWGEEIVLVIAADTVPAFPSTILRTHLPKAIVRVESLPLTENGKIDRKHLKEVHIKP